MNREEAVKFFKGEIQRLTKEEHVADWFNAKCTKELVAIECRTTKAFSDYMDDHDLSLEDEEIAEGECPAIALWASSSCYTIEDLVKDKFCFASRLAKEGGDYGKNMAAQMLDGTEFYNMTAEEMFSTEYAEEYDKKYGSDEE